MIGRNMLKKVYLVGSLFVILWMAILLRFFWIQIINGKSYQVRAEGQHKKEIPLQPKRGVIYDRNFNVLAFDLDSYSIAAEPQRVQNPEVVATYLSKILGKDKNYFLRELRENKSYVWLVRKALGEKSKWSGFQNFHGIYMIREPRRFYPHLQVASQVIGFTDIDNNGLGGVELQYDALLKGEAGWKILQVDGRGNGYPWASYPQKDPIDGENVVLTLDLTYQMIAEEELRSAVLESNAAGGMVVIMDPRTGEILVMAGYPSFNPNVHENFVPDRLKNKAVTDIFDPGSTFKIVTASAALEEKIVNPEDRIYCEKGQMKIPGGYIIHDYKKYEWLSFREIVEKSSNIGIIKIARKVGKKKLFEYARYFGFSNSTGVNLPGEADGILRNPVEWPKGSLEWISIGQGVAVTALQLISAYAAIANDGILMKPQIVKAIYSNKGQLKEAFKPQAVRRVISARTAKILAKFLEGAVQQGTGINAQVKGLRIAGKTGTAQKFIPTLRTYSKDQLVASFVGFFPVEDPRLVCLVVIDEPREKAWGGEVAAPVFKNIVTRIIASSNDPRVWFSEVTENRNVNEIRVSVSIPDEYEADSESRVSNIKMALSENSY